MTRRLDVLMIGNHLSQYGCARSVSEELADRLRARGHGVCCASSRHNRALRLADMLHTVWQRRTEYSVAQVDVFSGPAFHWAEIVCGLLRFVRKPYVLTLHGGGLPEFARTMPKRVRRLLVHANAVTSPSGFLVNALRSHREDIHVLPNGIDVTAFSYRVRSSLEPRLAWIRSFHSIYNPELAVKVVALLRPELPNVRLIMIGPDKGDGSLTRTRTVAAELGVAGNIDFVAGVPRADIPRFLARNDIFLNTTNVDNTPVSIIEAMASGLCAVSTDAGGVRYVIQHGRDGILTRCGDARAMAEAVLVLLRHPERAASISTQARNKAQGFDWQAILPQWEAVLELTRGAAA
jgi:glycosyltransferase involved in cell wall biosynthesis